MSNSKTNNSVVSKQQFLNELLRLTMPAMITMKNMEIKRIMNEIHLVMLRYTLDASPLDEADDYAEMVRFACADLAHAQLLANRLEEDNFRLDGEYFVRSHTVVAVVPQQQTSK
jgi:hypothetical protein